MSSYEYDDRRNADGVPDPTAFRAIKRADRERKRRERLEDRLGDLEHQVELLRKQCARQAVRLEGLARGMGEQK